MSTNPTWVRSPGAPPSPIIVPRRHIDTSAFQNAANMLMQYYMQQEKLKAQQNLQTEKLKAAEPGIMAQQGLYPAGAEGTFDATQMVEGPTTELPYAPFKPKSLGRMNVGGTEYGMVQTSPTNIKFLEGKERGPYKVGKIQQFKRGDEWASYMFTGQPRQDQEMPGWERMEGLPTTPRYKPETIINMPNTVQAQLQKGVLNDQQMLADLQVASNLFQPEYLTYAGRGKAFLSKQVEKFGGRWETDFLSGYSIWAGHVDKMTLTYRKLITGVAGSAKEMRDISKTYINTKYDSPTTYQQKLEMYTINTKAAMQRKQAALATFSKPWPSLTPAQKASLAKKYPFAFPKANKREQQKIQTADDYLKSKGLK